MRQIKGTLRQLNFDTAVLWCLLPIIANLDAASYYKVNFGNLTRNKYKPKNSDADLHISTLLK